MPKPVGGSKLMHHMVVALIGRVLSIICQRKMKANTRARWIVVSARRAIIFMVADRDDVR